VINCANPDDTFWISVVWMRFIQVDADLQIIASELILSPMEIKGGIFNDLA
jgi:hypothetical protein